MGVFPRTPRLATPHRLRPSVRRRLDIGVWGATEQRKQLSVVTDGSEAVYRPTFVLGSPTTGVGEGRHPMQVHSHATDESSLGNKAPNPNSSATRGYSLTAFAVPLRPRPQ